MWQDTNAVGQAAAAVSGDISSSDNGFNVIEEARCVVDKEIERIDQVGIATLGNIFKRTRDDKLMTVRHSQRWFPNADDAKKTYVRN